METKVNEEVIETARLAWNEITTVLGDELGATFSESEEDKESFKVFYKTLVETLFEDQDLEGY